MAAGYANINYDFYGVGSAAGDANQSIPLNQQVMGALVDAARGKNETAICVGVGEAF